jgi:methenyltetrahydromethanopterin cyclohydrolase
LTFQGNTKKKIEELTADIARYDDAIKEITKRINEHTKYEYEKPEAAAITTITNWHWYWTQERFFALNNKVTADHNNTKTCLAGIELLA